ncbi:hypothetical protein LCGC14_1487980, partial [marine sediment metagenome]
MAVGPFDAGRLRRRPAFDNLVTRIREDDAAVRDAAPPPEVAPEPFSNTVALLRERGADADPAAAVPVVARADETPLVDIDLENGFVLTPQGFVQKPGAKPDPVAVFDRDTGRLSPLSGFQRVLPGNPVELLAALQHDVDRILGREGEVEAEVQVPSGPDQFREAAPEAAAEPFDLRAFTLGEVEARAPLTFEEAAAQIEPIPLQPHVFVKDGTEIPEERVGPGLRFSREELEAKGFVLTRETELDPPTRGGRELFFDPVNGWTTVKPLPGILGDISLTIRRAAVTPLFEVAGVPISATDIVGIILIGYGVIQGGRAVWPSVKNLPSTTVDKALNVRVGQAQVDKWVATQGRLPPETQSRLGRWLVGNRTWLVERATKNLTARQAAARAAGQTPQQAAQRAASDTMTDAAAKARADLGGAFPVPAAPGVVPAAQPAPSTGNVVSIQQVISGIIGRAGTAEALGGIVAQAPAGPVGGVPQRRDLPPQLTDAGIVRASLDPATGEVLPPPSGSDLVRAVGEAFYVPEELGLAEATRIIQAGGVAPTAPPIPQSVSAPPPPDEVGLIETRPQAIPAPETLVAEDAAVAQVDSTIPPVPPEPPRSFLTFGDAQFDRYKGTTPNPIPGTRPFSERIRGFGKELEKAFTDEFARLNALGWQSEVDAALTRAASGQAQEIYRQAFNQIRNALGKDGSLVEFVDDYLVLRHQLEVMRATGRKTFRVTKGGKTQTFTPKQIQGLFVSMKNQLGPDAYARVKQAASVVPSIYHDILRGTQELTAEQIEGLIKKFPWYNPILFEDEFSTGATILNPNSKLQGRQIKRLTEFSSDKQLTTPLTALANTINRRVAANARNDARGSIAQDAIANPKAAGGDVEIVEAKPSGASFDFFENGVRKWAKLGPGSEWIAKDIELLTSQPKNIINRFARAINSIPRQFFTTYNPGFVATNTLFDGLTAFFAEGIGPRGFTKALLKNVKDMFIENETVNRFRLAGGDVGGFFRAREAAAAEEFITRSKTGVITLKNPKDLKRFTNPFILIRELGHAGENAARVAAYEKGIKDGLPDREAGLRGRRITVDFSRAGTASRVINDWFLFFNAGLQGFMLPGRRIASDPRSLGRLAVLLAGYLGLTLYNTSYDEYQDVSLSDRKGWLIIMVPSDEYDNRGRKVPHYIRVLPLREFALVTGPVELVVGGLKTDAPEAYRTLAQEFEAWYPVWSPLSMITQTGGVELPTQALQTIQQIINNHDTFRDRDIVDEDMKLLPAALQYDQFTDSLA